MVQQVSAILLGIYLLLESIHAAAVMHGGESASRVVKYLITGAIGIWMIEDARQVDLLHFTMSGALALFIWPSTYERLQILLDDLET